MSRKGRRSLWPSRNRWPRKSCRARPYQLAPFRATSTLGRRSHSSCSHCWRRRHFLGGSGNPRPRSRLRLIWVGSKQIIAAPVPESQTQKIVIFGSRNVHLLLIWIFFGSYLSFLEFMNNTKTRFFYFGFPKRSSRSGPTKKSAPEPPLKIRLCNTVCKLQYCYVMIRIIVNYYRFVRKDRLVWFLYVHNCIFFYTKNYLITSQRCAGLCENWSRLYYWGWSHSTVGLTNEQVLKQVNQCCESRSRNFSRIRSFSQLPVAVPYQFSRKWENDLLKTNIYRYLKEKLKETKGAKIMAREKVIN